MAMLAEPRQRKRYNLVPRGKALYEDDSRFGTKMLEKMGWSKGKGLGANEDGSQDFVRVRYKNDIQGLGYEQRDDQWTEHESNFSCLLSSLNGKKTETDEKTFEEDLAHSEDEVPRIGFGFSEEKPQSSKKETKVKLKENISGISLEEKSRKSKARVHYKKFTRGKDLSQYSEKDLANIFGKKAVDEEEAAHREDIFQKLNKDFKQNESEKEEYAVVEHFSGVQTISTGLSVSDYFKMKMATLKNRQQTQNQTTSENLEKSKKKKKSKMPENENVMELVNEKFQTEENAEDKKVKKKKKEKKDKSMEREEGNLCQAKRVPDASITATSIKKKCSTESECSPIENQTEEKSSKSKKKKKPDHQENLDTTDEPQNAVVTYTNEEGKITCDVNLHVKTQIHNDHLENTNTRKRSKKRSTGKNTCNEFENESSLPKKSKPNDVSGEPTDLPLQDLQDKINSFNIYRISSFCAEKFRNLNLNYFPKSSLPQIEGYSIDGDVQLKIETIKTDEMRITRLWDNTLSKYALVEKETKQAYQKYVKETFKAKNKNKKTVTAL